MTQLQIDADQSRTPLEERYRPQTFEDVLGQPAAVAALSGHIQKRRARSLLLAGNKGTGKTTLALIYARALLCERPTDSGSPCQACTSCGNFARGRVFDYEEFNCADLGVRHLAEVLNTSSASPWGGKRRVYFLDEAHNLHPRAFDLLLTVLENPGHRVFVLATTRPETLPATLRDRLEDHELRLLDRATSRSHLIRICRDEGFDYDADGLGLLVELAQGHARSLVRHLAKVAEGGFAVTGTEVRDLFNLGDVAALATYLMALIDDDLQAQLTFDESWREAPATKAEWIRRVLLHLYETEVVGWHRPSLVMGAIPSAARDRIVCGLNARAVASGISLPEFWMGLLELLAPPEKATPTWFSSRLHRVHQYVNERPATVAILKQPSSAGRLPRTSARVTAARGRAASLGRSAHDDVRPRYLSNARAAELWAAASALMQLYGLTFNLRIIIRHDELGLDQGRGAALAAAVVHELGQGTKRWTSCRAELHYAYLHQVSEHLGFTTTIIGHVPPQLADDVDEWLFDRFLPRRINWSFPKSAVRLKMVSADLTPKQRVRWHWQLVGLLCRNLDPSLQVRAAGEDRALLAVLGVNRRLREPLGALTLAQPCRVSRTLGQAALKRADEALPLLSAWRDGAWSHIASGWELEEHADRVREAEERAWKRAVVITDWPGDGVRERRIREMKLAELEASWSRDPHRRSRSWLPWWAEALRLPQR